MSIGCLKICHNGVSQPISGSHFPRYQSVTHNCTWIVSCIGWHINIGKWCKEDSESGYKLIQIIQCLKKKKKRKHFSFTFFVFFSSCCFLKTILFLWQLGFYVFNPSLVGSNLAKTITFESVVKLWVLIFNLGLLC